MPLLYVILGDLQSGVQEFRRGTAFFCERPDYLLLAQPSGLLQYHDQRDTQYDGAALAFAYFFSFLWRNISLAWSESSLAAFRRREAVPTAHKAFLRGHFENLHNLMLETKGNCLTEQHRSRLRREALLTVLFLGSMYNPSLDRTVYDHARRQTAAEVSSASAILRPDSRG